MFDSKIMFSSEQYEEYYNERFIYGKELSHVLEIMRTHDNYRILILGAAGTGKSTFLYLLSYYTASKKPIEIIKGFSINENSFDNLNGEKTPIFIDGLNEIEYPYGLLHFLNGKNCDKLVCASRPNMPQDICFTHVVKLNPTHEHIVSLITKLGLSDTLLHSLSSNKHSNMTITPKEILSYIVCNLQDSDLLNFYSGFSSFLYQYGNGTSFSSDIIYPENKIIVPSKGIIKGVTLVDDSLLRRAKKDPRIIHSFSPREFEEMVCELLDKQGFEVKLTKQTRDGGKDIIVVQKSVLGEFCIYVECKKYDISRPISVGLVRELYGTVMVDNATAGMIITTSHFSKDAKEYTEQIKHRMTLKDYNDLVQALNKINC